MRKKEAYEEHLKWLRIEMNTLKKAEAKGRAQGLAEGKAEGIEEGLAEGKLLIARNLLSKGVDIKLISETTGLSEEELKSV